MWGAKTKDKAVDVWHNKAMLVDPNKTKITMTWNATSEICETKESSETRALNFDDHPKIIMASNAYPAKDLEAADPNFEVVEQNFKTMETKIDEAADFDETTENLETPKLNFETAEPEAIKARKANFSAGSEENALANLGDMELNSETAELDDSGILSTNETSEILENEQLNPQRMESLVTEAQNPIQSKEGTGKMEQNLEIVEVRSPEVLNTIASSENSTVAESNGIEAVTICKTEDSNFESWPIEKETENAMFLRVLKKTRAEWYNDKKFAKIVQKMEKGKNLKRKEFDKVYMHIHDYCQYNQLVS